MPPHARRWAALIRGAGLPVRVTNYITPQDSGEVINDDPPSQEISWDQWVIDHASIYGLTLDGHDRATVQAVRAAWNRVTTKAAGDPDWQALAVLLRAAIGDPPPADPP